MKTSVNADVDNGCQDIYEHACLLQAAAAAAEMPAHENMKS
jgi:hypothetical protein